MIHINRSEDNKFYVVVDNDNPVNREILSTSELLKSKQAAWKNIKGQTGNFTGWNTWLTVTDNTFKKPVVYDFNPWLNVKNIVR